LWFKFWPVFRLAEINIVLFDFKGLAIAQRLKGFEVSKIIYNDVHENTEGNELGYEYVSFDELLQTADFVICACAATKETYKLFNKETFDKMHPNLIFVNISRGTVVDHDDLYDALNNRQIVAAG
jgi:glyoxylate reductase